MEQIQSCDDNAESRHKFSAILDELKIDRSFVSQMHESEGDLAIVHMVMSLAHELNLKVVAEGVETQEQQEIQIHDQHVLHAQRDLQEVTLTQDQEALTAVHQDHLEVQ